MNASAKVDLALKERHAPMPCPKGFPWLVCIGCFAWTFSHSFAEIDWSPVPERVMTDWSYSRSVLVRGSHCFYEIADSVLVADVSNPASPLLLSAFRIPGQLGEMALLGDEYLLVVNGSYLAVLDTSDVNRLRLAGRVLLSSKELEGPVGIAVSGTRAYVACRQGGLATVDLSEPSRPREMARLQLPGMARSVTLKGDTAYVACESGFGIVSIAEPQPRLISCFKPPYSVDRVIEQDGILLLATKESSRSVDIRNGEVAVLSEAKSPSFGYWAFPYQLQLVGDQVFSATGEAGLEIMDWKNPRDLRTVVTMGSYQDAGPYYVAYSTGVHHDARGYAFLTEDPWWQGERGLTVLSIKRKKDEYRVRRMTTLRYPLVMGAGWGGTVAISPPSARLAASADSLLLYVATGEMVRVFSLREGNAPLLQRELPIGGRPSAVAAVAPGWVAVADGLRVGLIDANKPDLPKLGPRFDFGNDQKPGPWIVRAQGGWLYVSGGAQRLIIFDCREPAKARTVLQVDPGSEVKDMAIQGQFCYLATEKGVSVVDVSDPSKARLVGTCPTEATPTAIAGNERFVLVAERGGICQLIDARDPAKPVAAARLELPSAPGILDLAMDQDKGFAACGSQGLALMHWSGKPDLRLDSMLKGPDGLGAWGVALLEKGLFVTSDKEWLWSAGFTGDGKIAAGQKFGKWLWGE